MASIDSVVSIYINISLSKPSDIMKKKYMDEKYGHIWKNLLVGVQGTLASILVKDLLFHYNALWKYFLDFQMHVSMKHLPIQNGVNMAVCTTPAYNLNYFLSILLTTFVFCFASSM